MSRRLSLPLRQFCLGCRIGYVGDIPCHEKDIWMQMQGNMQENPGLFSVMHIVNLSREKECLADLSDAP